RVGNDEAAALVHLAKRASPVGDRRTWRTHTVDSSMTRELTQRQHGITQLLGAGATAQIRPVDDERAAHDRSAGHADELERRFRRAAGCDQVVHEQHALAVFQRVSMHLEAIDTVLELVVLAEILGGQLAALPYRHESGMQPIS